MSGPVGIKGLGFRDYDGKGAMGQMDIPCAWKRDGMQMGLHRQDSMLQQTH